MPLVFVRSKKTRELIAETRSQVREELRGLTDDDVAARYFSTKAEYEYAVGSDERKTLYHELAVCRAEYLKRRNTRNAKLAKKYESLMGGKRLKCPHCGKSIRVTDATQ